MENSPLWLCDWFPGYLWILLNEYFTYISFIDIKGCLDCTKLKVHEKLAISNIVIFDNNINESDIAP